MRIRIWRQHAVQRTEQVIQAITRTASREFGGWISMVVASSLYTSSWDCCVTHLCIADFGMPLATIYENDSAASLNLANLGLQEATRKTSETPQSDVIPYI